MADDMWMFLNDFKCTGGEWKWERAIKLLIELKFTDIGFFFIRNSMLWHCVVKLAQFARTPSQMVWNSIFMKGDDNDKLNSSIRWEWINVNCRNMKLFGNWYV